MLDDSSEKNHLKKVIKNVNSNEDSMPMIGGGKKKGSKKMTGGTKKKGSKKTSKKMTGGMKKKGSKKTSKKMTGGMKKKGSKKTSKKMTGSIKKKGSKNTSKKSKKGSKKISGGGNAGFEAFQELKKKVASVLNIPNDGKASRAARVAMDKIKKKNPGMNSVDRYKKAFELVKSNIEKYRKESEKKPKDVPEIWEDDWWYQEKRV